MSDFIFIPPAIGTKFYTGPRFRRHKLKPDQWKNARKQAAAIKDPFWRLFMLKLVNELEKKFSEKAAR